MSEVILPWNNPPLDKWSIVGMNHYSIKGQRHLFVAMLNRDSTKCIRAEGSDELEVFEKLCNQAKLLERKNALVCSYDPEDGSAGGVVYGRSGYSEE